MELRIWILKTSVDSTTCRNSGWFAGRLQPVWICANARRGPKGLQALRPTERCQMEADALRRMSCVQVNGHAGHYLAHPLPDTRHHRRCDGGRTNHAAELAAHGTSQRGRRRRYDASRECVARRHHRRRRGIHAAQPTYVTFRSAAGGGLRVAGGTAGQGRAEQPACWKTTRNDVLTVETEHVINRA